MMKSTIKNIKFGSLTAAAAMLLFTACNKEMPEIEGPTQISPNPISFNSKALGDTLGTPARANDSLYYRLVVKAGMLSTLNNNNLALTAFVPTNAAMRTFITAISGGAVPAGSNDALYSGFIQSANLPVASAAGIVSYNLVPQKLLAANFSTTFPNFQYPTFINPAPQVSPLVRLTTFPSNRNGVFLNNTAIVSTDNLASNGVFHETSNLVAPPTQFLWERISADADLSYLKAAIIRADSGVTSASTLQSALLNIGANLTVYAPTDAAFRTTLTGAIYQALVPIIIQQLIPVITAQLISDGATPAEAAAQAPALAAAQAPAIAIGQATALASTPDVFSNPLLYGALSAQTVKGIVVYHIMGVRAFNNNLPTTATNYPTLLNSAIAAHPGIGLKATLAGTFVTSATVKGAANAAAANILINPTPAPNGTSDQFYLNGNLQKIDQVLMPQ